MPMPMPIPVPVPIPVPARTAKVSMSIVPPPDTRRALLLLLLVSSFLPYLRKPEDRPQWYRDGKSPTEIARSQQLRATNRFLHGDLSKTEFGHEVFRSDETPPHFLLP